jgi:hypothetical protein
MFKYLIVSIALFQTLNFSVRAGNLDFSLQNGLPPEGKLTFGWDLINWNDWLKRDSSGPLLIVDSIGKSKLEVFEAHGAAVVSKPIGFFTRDYLHNISTIRQLDPQDTHEIFTVPNVFAVETRVPFPQNWALLIAAGKATTYLEAKSTDYLDLISFFDYKSGDQISADGRTLHAIERLDILGKTPVTIPQVINVQSIVQINQIAQFGRIITFFYQVDTNHTLIVNYLALALKHRDLSKGLDKLGFTLTGRSVLLGEGGSINSPTGIGAGLPEYTSELFSHLVRGINEAKVK